MTGSLFCEFFDNQTAFIRKAARDWDNLHSPEVVSTEWKVRGPDAVFASDVQELAQLCIVLTPLCDAVWKSAQKSLLENRSLDYQDFGDKVRDSFDAALRAFDSVRSCIRTASNLGCVVENRTDFEDAEQAVIVARERFLSRWPWVDQGTLRRSAEQYALGQYQDLDELLNELQGHPAGGGHGEDQVLDGPKAFPGRSLDSPEA